ncbi:Sugar transporter STL1 [Pseudocercospora fuligena]|uniref:Sugar transporter STL1 n=1 Tax=Pseudocercospora fuligena TaxID=685502 RepID=A0A8H6VER2_9PEZI|nr:Sugar transporter STL1 [Pseudocercospora fuligena]
MISPRYVQEVNIGLPDGTVTNVTKQGGIVSIVSIYVTIHSIATPSLMLPPQYYLGAIVGCFLGGWLADRIGRVNGLFYGAMFALVGGALQAATQSATFILVARVVTGLGTGALTGITPVLISEVSNATHRGGMLGYVFIANYLGISVAYWLSFGLAFINNGYSDIRWRFLLAFQCIPAIVLLAGIRLLPDSPRFLASKGRLQEAKEVLEHVRGGRSSDVDFEFKEICAMAEHSKPNSPIEFGKILLGLDQHVAPHLTRRAWLCLWLQIMASWTGITAVTAYSPVLLSQAGYSTLKQNGLAGGLNTIGIIGTIISAQIVDRIGRRTCLMGGAAGLALVNLIAAILYEVSIHKPAISTSIAPAAVTMLFLFNLIYASTWGTVAFLVPTEIFPSDLRAQGNGFGITGWAIGVGMTVLVNPIMFGDIKSRTYFLFAGLNLLWVPIVYFLYPETANRSLESIEAMFSSSSPLYSHMESAYHAGREDLSAVIEQDVAVEKASSYLEERA